MSRPRLPAAPDRSRLSLTTAGSSMVSHRIAYSRQLGYDASHAAADAQSRVSRGRARHAVPARDQGPAEGDAAARRQADRSSTASRRPSHPASTNIILVTGRGKNAIEDHFDVTIELESVSRGARQDANSSRRSARSRTSSTSPTSARVSRSVSATRSWSRSELVGDEPFAVILGDDVIDAKPPALKQMIDVLRARWTGRSSPSSASRGGCLELRHHRRGSGARSRPRRLPRHAISSRSRRARMRRRTSRSSALHPHAGHLRRARRDRAGPDRARFS